MTDARASSEAPVPTGRPSRMPAVLVAARPRQWVKNLLVYSAPLASGRFTEGPVLWHATIAAVAFVLASVGVYLVNDVLDLAEDRAHPTKRLRPIAAGRLSTTAALTIAIVSFASALVLAWWLNANTAIVIAVYAALQVVYSAALKHQPIIDLAIVASGFMLRAITGGVATGIPLSQWFLLVAGFGSLFMVAGKRYSELVQLGSDAGTRRSLKAYSASYLRFVWMLACTMVLVSYSLWAFNAPAAGIAQPWAAISIAPFTFALLRYAMEIDVGNGGTPEDVALHDHVLQLLAAAWLGCVVIGAVL